MGTEVYADVDIPRFAPIPDNPQYPLSPSDMFGKSPSTIYNEVHRRRWDVAEVFRAQSVNCSGINAQGLLSLFGFCVNIGDKPQQTLLDVMEILIGFDHSFDNTRVCKAFPSYLGYIDLSQYSSQPLDTINEIDMMDQTFRMLHRWEIKRKSPYQKRYIQMAIIRPSCRECGYTLYAWESRKPELKQIQRELGSHVNPMRMESGVAQQQLF